MPTLRDDVAGPARPTGLVLTGGGARAAYQVGVLGAVMEILDPDFRPGCPNPFQIICGTSAGAVNAAAMACRADRPHLAVRRMRRLWSSLDTSMVYRADAPGLIRSGVRWLGLLSLGWMYSGVMRKRPQSLLDSQPLANLLERVLNFRRMRHNLARGHLSALAITASGYTSGEHLTFYQSDRPIEPWHRSLRRAVPSAIGVDHVMASSAIPLVFPARAVNVQGQTEWCGDGSMRQLAPISPAIHLGAERVLVVGTSFQDETHPEQRAERPAIPRWPRSAAMRCPASSWTACPSTWSAWNAPTACWVTACRAPSPACAASRSWPSRPASRWTGWRWSIWTPCRLKCVPFSAYSVYRPCRGDRAADR